MLTDIGGGRAEFASAGAEGERLAAAEISPPISLFHLCAHSDKVPPSARDTPCSRR